MRTSRTLTIIGLSLGVALMLGGCAAAAPEPLSDDPLTALGQSIERSLGSSNRDVERMPDISYDAASSTVTVVYALNDNLTNDMIITGAWQDNGDILEAAQNSALPIATLINQGTLSLTNGYGEELGETPVVTVVFEQTAIDTAVLDNLPGSMLESAADMVTIRHDVLG